MNGAPNVARKLSSKPALLAPASIQPSIEFALASPSTHSPQPIFPNWSLARATKEVANIPNKTTGFTDADGTPKLPPSLAALCVGWKRLGELYPVGIAEKLSITPSEGIHTMHHVRSATSGTVQTTNGWNQIVAAQFNLILAKRKLFTSNGNEQALLWNLITAAPTPSKDGLVRLNPLGKYVLRAFHQGDWKMVVIDDQIPVDAQGQSLLPVSANPMEVWPILLTKLVLKLWPGYEFDHTGGTEILYTLCGWLVQSHKSTRDLVDFPYSKSNRPSSPLLPFNPLTDSTFPSPTASPLLTRPQSTASARESVTSMPVAPSNKVGHQRSMTIGAGMTKGGIKSPVGKKGEEMSDEMPSLPPQPLSTDQLHGHTSKRGELGWFNELVYAASGSSHHQPTEPSGLLFAYAWARTGSGVEGYPSLASQLDAEPSQLPFLGAYTYDFDASQTPLAIALSQPPPNANSTSPVTPAKGRSASIAGVGMLASKSSAGKPTPLTPATPVVSMTPAQVEPPETPAWTPLAPKYHCLLLDYFDLASERLELDARLGGASESLPVMSKAKTLVSKGPGTPSSASASSSVANKRSAASPSPVSPLGPTGAKRESTSASGTKPGTAKSRRREEEERLRKLEEDEHALALEQAIAQAREEDIARTLRAQTRMEAWLRGEENMLAEEELAKTTPQLKLTDLQTGATVVVRVDSFADMFAHVALVRSFDRYAYVSKVVDLWCGKDVRRPFSSSVPSTLFVPDPTPSQMPSYVPTTEPTPLDLPTLVAQGMPKEAVLARQKHQTSEYQSARVIEASAHARTLYVHLEFQTNHQLTSGVTDAETCANLPQLVRPGTFVPPSSLIDGLKSAVSKPSSSSSKARPPSTSASASASGKSSKHNSASAASPATGAAATMDTVNHLGPLHIEPPPPPHTWTLQVERYDWRTGRREIVLEQRHDAASDNVRSASPARLEKRLELVELKLPSMTPDDVAASQAATLAYATSNPSVRPTTSGAKSSGATKTVKEKVATPTAPNAHDTRQQPGIVYRVIVSSNFGYAMNVFGHHAFTLEEGKPGQTALLHALASGETSNSGAGPSGSGSNKKDVQPLYGSTLFNGTQTPLLEASLPSTYVKQLEGLYPSQNPGATFVLFKYVVEVPTPAAGPLDPSSSTDDSAASSSGSPIPTPSSAKSRTPKQSANSRSGSSERRKTQATTTTTPTVVTPVAEAIPPSSTQSFFNKHRMPTSAADANTALAQPWLHPIIGQAGGGVCAPVTAIHSTPTLPPIQTKSVARSDDATTEMKEDGAASVDSSSLSSSSSTDSSVDTPWPSSLAVAPSPLTLISVQLMLQDVALAPHVCLEWVCNDTLSSWRIPSLDAGVPMCFRANQRGYTLIATACVTGYQLFAGKYHCKITSSQPLTNFLVEPLTSQLALVDEYRTNTSRTLARLLVSGTTSVGSGGKGSEPSNTFHPQSFMSFHVNVAPAGLICRVWDLDESLEYPIAHPPPPLTTILSAGTNTSLTTGYGGTTINVPVLFASKESRLLVEITFDPLRPSKEVLQQYAALSGGSIPIGAIGSSGKDVHGSSQPSTGINWTARFISSAPVSVALDKAPEDELLALKTSWSQGDSQRSKKARQIREQFLEAQKSGLPSERKGLDKSKVGAPSAIAGGSLLASGVVPLPPIVLRQSLDDSLPIVLTDTMRSERRHQLQSQLDQSRVLKLSLERQHQCLTDFQQRLNDQRESDWTNWRQACDRDAHEFWSTRNELRKNLIQSEVELAELRAVLNQTHEQTANLVLAGNYEEIQQAPTPFNQFNLATTMMNNTSAAMAKDKKDKEPGTTNSNKKNKTDAISSIDSGRFGLGAYLQTLQTCLEPVLHYPPWKGGALCQAVGRRVQQVLIDSLHIPLAHARQSEARRQASSSLISSSSPPTPNGPKRLGGSETSGKERTPAKNASASNAASMSELPIIIDKQTLGSALWIGVQHTRGMLTQLSSVKPLTKLLVGSEAVLLALALEQLDRAIEPLRLQAIAAEKDRLAALKSEEEKTNGEGIDSPPPSRNLKEKSSSKSAKAAAAAALAASIPPPTDWQRLEDWCTQVRQYSWLDDELFQPAHDTHHTLVQSFSTGHLARVDSPTSRPNSALATPARASLDPPMTTPIDEANEPVQWFNAGGNNDTEEKQQSSPSSPSQPCAYMTPAVPYTLPPHLPNPLDRDEFADAISSAATSLGRDSLAIVLAHLPSDAGVHPSELLPAAPLGGHSPHSSPSSPDITLTGVPLSVCGVCFLRALIARSRSLLAHGEDALEQHRMELDRQATRANAALKEKELVDMQHQPVQSQKGKKMTSPSSSHKKTPPLMASGSNKKSNKL